ncbi:Zn-dependent hydrolase [Pseudonocardia spinosispora]|uniref:Zn-dependent hydrolase n=1 Tax=Pseudonocardia spinosispora TaxID=103441 RepID=UPI000A055751|nr:Zn-dependent hydrolase [Pseudonocardia spinosispora]
MKRTAASGTTVTATPATVTALIDEFAALSEPRSGPGVTRLAYTPLERRAHDVFTERMRAAGLRVWTDAAGNTIAERQGTVAGLPAIGTGSHLDSVPNAGTFDGVAGVVAAMEVARLFTENAVTHRHPLRFVVFAAEEGARFGQACTGSRIAAGLTTAADLDRFTDAEGTTLREAMRGSGIDPDRVDEATWMRAEWAAFVELHIEQGSVLDSSGTGLGVVDVISGSTRFRVDLHGRAAHSGGTPMELRIDALTAAAEIVLIAEELASDDEHDGTRVTVGRLDVEPNSITTIPGDCRLYVDVRDVDPARQRATADEVLARARTVADRRGVGFRSDMLADASPVALPQLVRDAMAAACDQLDRRYRILPSGASHDSQMISRVCPVGMLFVPSLNHGVSHSPDELSTAEDITSGIEVLAATLLSLDTGLQTG